ncbi:MAG: response regulator [Planctomycetota bacterium]
MGAVSLPDKEVWSTGELAAMCGVTKHTIITAIERNELRASQTPGGHNRILRRDAIDFMRRRNVLPAEVENTRILVVDDEEFVFTIVDQLYGCDGCEVEHAATGYEAGKLAERYRPDVILLDIMLPDCDGREVCRHIREESYGGQCSIIAVTALRGEEEIDGIYDAGMDDYLAKPFTIDRLREKVDALLPARQEEA